MKFKLLRFFYTPKHTHAYKPQQDLHKAEQDSKPIDDHLDHQHVSLQDQVKHKEEDAQDCNNHKLEGHARLLSFVSFWAEVDLDELDEKKEDQGYEFKFPYCSGVGEAVYWGYGGYLCKIWK